MDFPVSIVEAASAADSVDGGISGVVETASATDLVDAVFADCYVDEACVAQDKSDFYFTAFLTPSIFRQIFTAFADVAIYSDFQVMFYLSLAVQFLNPHRWGNSQDRIYQYGQALFAAHLLALERQASSNKSGVPGTVIGVVNSGSVDKVSYGRDVASVMEDGAGHWGMTTYGLQYLRLVRMLGSGPVQVGAGIGGPAGFGSLIRDSNFFLPQSASEFAGIDQAWSGPQTGPW